MTVRKTHSLRLVFVLLALLMACVTLPVSSPPASVTATPASASPTQPESLPTALPASPTPYLTPAPIPTSTPEPSPTSPPSLRFAVIGDFGDGGQAEADVAGLVHGWSPDIIITVGDNNYPSGAADT